MQGWISVRNEWPTAPGTYKVWDCRKDIKTKLDFDGMHFAQSIIKYAGVGQGNFSVTHWKEVRRFADSTLSEKKLFPPQIHDERGFS